MNNIENILKAYEYLRICETLLDKEAGFYQKHPEQSELTDLDYAEIHHALGEITNAEAALFGVLMDINDRKMDPESEHHEEWWTDLDLRREMHNTSPKDE